MNKKKTLEVIGWKMIDVQKSMSDTKRATIAVTITTLGEMLSPLAVFKGVPKEKIKREEFRMYPPVMLYCMQANAWMDKHVMMFWVHQKPNFCQE